MSNNAVGLGRSQSAGPGPLRRAPIFLKVEKMHINKDPESIKDILKILAKEK